MLANTSVAAKPVGTQATLHHGALAFAERVGKDAGVGDQDILGGVGDDERTVRSWRFTDRRPSQAADPEGAL